MSWTTYVVMAVTTAGLLLQIVQAHQTRRTGRLQERVLALHLAAAERARDDEAAASEARRICAAAKRSWTHTRDEHIAREPFALVEGPQRDEVVWALADGVDVPWNGARTKELAERVIVLPGVVHATVTPTGYRVAFRIDAEHLQLAA